MNASTRWGGRSLSNLVRFFGMLILIAGLTVGFVSRWSSGQAQSADFADDGIVVVNTDFLNLREEPSLDAAVLYVFKQGTALQLNGAPVDADGYTWYPVVGWGRGTMYGWMASEYLLPVNGQVPVDPVQGGFADLDTVRVATDLLNVRTGPGLDYAVVRQLTEGTPLMVGVGPVVADGYSWYPLAVPDQPTSGWVAGEYLVLADGGGSSGDFADGDAVVVATDFLNLRADASLSASVVDVLAEGEALTILSGPLAADGYSWYSVRTNSGASGWVAGEYLAFATSGTGSYTGFDIGDSAVVDTPRLNFRTGPGLDYGVIEVITGGTSVAITDGPVSADGYHWYELELESGETGWSIGEGLA